MIVKPFDQSYPAGIKISKDKKNTANCDISPFDFA